MAIDFTPLIDQVIFPIIAAVVVPFAIYAIQKVAKLAHVQLEAAQAAKLETALQNGINFALSRAQDYADQHATVPTKSAIIEQATAYVIPKVPGALAQLGITPAGVAERIEARLNPEAVRAITPSSAG